VLAPRPAWRLTEKEWCRRWWTMLNTVVLWLVMIGVIVWIASRMLDPDKVRYYDLLTRAPWELLRNVSVPLTLALADVVVFYDIFAWRKNWYDREPAPPWEPAYAIGLLGRKLAWAAWVVTLVCGLVPLRYDSMAFHKPDSADVKIEVPAVSLQTIEGDAYIGYAGDVGVNVGYRKGLLLPLEVQITDWEDWTTGDGNFWYRGMTFTYYRLRSEESALRLAEENRHDTALPLTDPCGFDAAWWVETDAREAPALPLGTTVLLREQYLTAVVDDVVITLHYEGSGDLPASLPELYHIVTAYRQQDI